jgi:CheY-like chemotaxis protein
MPGDEPIDVRQPVAHGPESIGTPELGGAIRYLNPTPLTELHREAVAAADDRPSTLPVAGRSQSDVAVLDLRWSVMTGYELAQGSRSSRPLRSIEAA